MSRINTDIVLISSLISGINKGEVKVPKFQRQFVWKNDQALSLLDSIANNYPVGSILLWKTKEKLRAERNIGEFALPETDDLEPTDYVLDGQCIEVESIHAGAGCQASTKPYQRNCFGRCRGAFFL